MGSASKVVASGWMVGSVVVSAAGEERSVIEGILTAVIARRGEQTHERSGTKERRYLINERVI
jgi:hypothetical protein